MKKAFFLVTSLGAVVATALVAAAAVAAEARQPAAVAAPAGADQAQIRCGRTRSIGLASFITGPAASLGRQQLRWARFYVTRYNARNRGTKFQLVLGDTQLPNTAQAVNVAQTFAANSRILAVVGPGGSQEVEATTAPFRNAGLGYISGSSTAVRVTEGGVRAGIFWRTVPRDDVQGARVAQYIQQTLRARDVFIIDDQETYGVGLADEVQRRLRAAGVNVRRDSVNPGQTTDFSSLIARIPASVRVVYLPWQLPPRAQQFGRQMREQGKTATLFGSDGLFAPGEFTHAGAYISMFPVNPRHPVLTAFRRTTGGAGDYFGAPTYVAVQVAAEAINRACRNGTASRAEVRREIARTRISQRNSLLGMPIRFNRNGDVIGGRFGIYRIVNGNPLPIG